MDMQDAYFKHILSDDNLDSAGIDRLLRDVELSGTDNVLSEQDVADFEASLYHSCPDMSFVDYVACVKRFRDEFGQG